MKIIGKFCVNHFLLFIILFLLNIYCKSVSAQVYVDYYDFLDDFYTNYQYSSDQTERGNQTLIERDALIWAPRLYPTGSFMDAYSANYEYTMDFNSPQELVGGGCAPQQIIPAIWEQLGPVVDNVNVPKAGQMHRITFHPNYDAVTNQDIYASSGFGGLWKSTNKGQTWNLMNTDNSLPFCGVADVAVAENSNIDYVYIATGYPDGNVWGGLSPNVAGVNPLFTQGVYRTIDNGANWEDINGNLMLNFANGGNIRRIIVDKLNHNNVWLATSNGIFRSQNAASASPTWTPGLLNGLTISDPQLRGIEFSATSTSTIYASGSDIYKSIDGGDTWTSMTGPLTGLDFSNLFVNYDDFIPERINIAVTPSNPNLIYAYIVGRYNDVTGLILPSRMFLYVFDETTGLWTLIFNEITSSFTDLYSQAYMPIAVDPNSPNMVYWGFTRGNRIDVNQVNPTPFEYHDYGTTGKYPDIHALVFDPIEEVLWEGHHGGISAYDLNTETFAYKNMGICSHIIWTFDDNEIDSKDIIASFQDQSIKTFQTISGIKKWREFPYVQDGFTARIYDDINKFGYFGLNPQSILHYDFNTFAINNLNTGYQSDPILAGYPYVSKTFPCELHPVTHEPYSGFSEIYKNLTLPIPNWTIESDIGKTVYEKWARQITELAISKSDPNTIYAIIQGVDNGTDPLTTWDLEPGLFKSTIGFVDGVSNYNNNNFFQQIDLYSSLTIPPYNNNGVLMPAISGIAVHPNNPDIIWITFVGFSSLHKVYRSDDGGATWINEDPNECLVNLPVNGIAYQDGTNDRLFIATDRGVYTKDNSSFDWQEYGDLPNVRVVEIKINYCNNSIKAATFGRGIFETDLLPTTGLNSELVINSSITWSADRFETGNIRIKDGATLTITSKLMMPFNGKIFVEDGSTLHLDGATITNSCDKMWDGIHLENTGSVFLMENSLIENSINGVNSFNGSNLIIRDGSTFNRNLNSVQIHPYANPNTASIYNTTFTCIDNNSTPTTLNYPYNTVRSSTAIKIDKNAGVSIGDNSLLSNKNSFYNHDYGIVSYYSHVSVKNCEFELIDDVVNPEDPNLYSGTAIYALAEKANQGTLWIGGNTPSGGFNTSEVSFKNCKRGVLAYQHITTDIQYTKSENLTLCGIDIQFCHANTQYLDFNDFQETNVGINIYESENSGLLMISNNNYFLGASSGTSTFLRRGIYVDNVINSNANLNINNNRIDGARIGIRVRNISDGVVNLNYVLPQTSGGTVNKFGIYLTSCTRSRVISNTIIRTVSIPKQRIEAMRGIRIDGCKGSTIHLNTTTGMGKGHYCFGNNSDTYYTCNVMDDCLEGVFMEAATLPNQGSPTTFPNDNRWVNMGSRLRIIETASTGNSHIWYHRGVFGSITNDFSPAPWNVFAINAIQTTGDGPCGLPDGIDPPKDRQQSFGNIVDESEDYTWLLDENKYFDREFLYNKMVSDPNFINQGLYDDPIYEQYRINTSTMNIGYAETLNELILNEELNDAINLNQSIADTNIIETNKKNVINTYLESYAVNDSSLDSGQIVILNEIAWQTQASGGAGVAMARSMLHLEIDDEFGTQFRVSEVKHNKDNINFECYPNPVSNFLTISRSEDNSKYYNVSIHGLKGDLMYEEKINSKNYNLKLSKFESGTYILKISEAETVLYSKSFVKL